MRDRLFRSLPVLVLAAALLGGSSWLTYVQQQRSVSSSHAAPSSTDLFIDSPSGSSVMELTTTDQMAIRSVIEQQLQAFQQNNADLAFSFASPGIQAQFKTPEEFAEMVEESYLPVYRPRSVMFEDIIRIDGKIAQQVVLMGPDGNLFNAFYLMQRQDDESWRINGCYLAPVQGQAT